jgi:hypothetical protein
MTAAVGQLAHVNATIIPFQLSGGWLSRRREWGRPYRDASERTEAVRSPSGRRAHEPEEKGQRVMSDYERAAFGERARGTDPIGTVGWRQRVQVAGRVKSVRVQPRAGTANLECVITDGTGQLLLVFQGRRRIPGIQPGARLLASGMVGDWSHRQAILNPDYELVAGPAAEDVRL